MAPKFKRLHAHVGHVWDIDKTDGSRVIVAEVDPHGFMGGLEARQEVAALLASAPRLQEQVRILREALALCEARLGMPWVERHLRTNYGDLTDLGEALRDIRQALGATKEGA